MTAEKTVKAHDHAKSAAKASHQMEEEIDWNSFFSDNEQSSSRYAGSATDRRISIKYLLLDIPTNCHSAVKETLLKISQKVEEYDGAREMGQVPYLGTEKSF